MTGMVREKEKEKSWSENALTISESKALIAPHQRDCHE